MIRVSFKKNMDSCNLEKKIEEIQGLQDTVTNLRMRFEQIACS